MKLLIEKHEWFLTKKGKMICSVCLAENKEKFKDCMPRIINISDTGEEPKNY